MFYYAVFFKASISVFCRTRVLQEQYWETPFCVSTWLIWLKWVLVWITRMESECWETIADHTTFSLCFIPHTETSMFSGPTCLCRTSYLQYYQRQHATQRELWCRYLWNDFKEKTDVMILSIIRKDEKRNWIKENVMMRGNACTKNIYLLTMLSANVFLFQYAGINCITI